MEFLQQPGGAWILHSMFRAKKQYLALLQYQDNLTADHIANAFHTLNLQAIGDTMSEDVKRRLYLGASITTAVLGAITFTGVGTVIALIAAVVAPLLIWFAIKSKRDFLGAMVNFTSTNLLCQNFTSKNGDLHMHAGKMEEFPKTTSSGVSAKEVTLKAMNNGSDDEGNIVELVYVAQFYAIKKTGFFGAEGTFALRPLDKSGPILTSLFASPINTSVVYM
ncbi:hypothetical protein [Pseudoalteromonas rubra]|uniref:Uncharacterized protein n=1 Tax=Pseudoalteromonas rubra TaxID=43658 RepID=A0A0U3I2N2_9GAMM|nr:hypothetical protein [Pseudoalteromonas rubra]ALU41904.1 hypothetical protein AT705_02555 [Pseudoalteromonas rubra]